MEGPCPHVDGSGVNNSVMVSAGNAGTPLPALQCRCYRLTKRVFRVRRVAGRLLASGDCDVGNPEEYAHGDHEDFALA